MSNFAPTWLMIKQHSSTGLKYFCKTIQKDPFAYKGSGSRWTNHLKVHGRDVITVWGQLFTDKDSLQQYAIKFSIENNIVKSTKWANLVVEDGITGWPPGTKHKAESIEKCKKNANGFKKGRTPHNKGKSEPKDNKDKRVASILEWRNNNPGWDKAWKEGQKKSEQKRLKAVSKITIVDGIKYPSATEAAKALGLKKTTLIKRVLSESYPTYIYDAA